MQRIFLLDATAALGWERIRELESESLALMELGIERAVEAGQIASRPAAPLAHLLFGGICELAMVVARAPRPAPGSARGDRGAPPPARIAALLSRYSRSVIGARQATHVLAPPRSPPCCWPGSAGSRSRAARPTRPRRRPKAPRSCASTTRASGTSARSGPSHCAHYGPGGSFGGGVNLKKLEWRSWGGRRGEGDRARVRLPPPLLHHHGQGHRLPEAPCLRPPVYTG